MDPKMDGLQWKILLKWMIWWLFYFRKPPYICTYIHTYIYAMEFVVFALCCRIWRSPELMVTTVRKSLWSELDSPCHVLLAGTYTIHFANLRYPTKNGFVWKWSTPNSLVSSSFSLLKIQFLRVYRIFNQTQLLFLSWVHDSKKHEFAKN